MINTFRVLRFNRSEIIILVYLQCALQVALYGWTSTLLQNLLTISLYKTVYVCVSNIQPKTSAPRLSGIAEYYSRGGKLKNILLIMM